MKTDLAPRRGGGGGDNVSIASIVTDDDGGIFFVSLLPLPNGLEGKPYGNLISDIF